jgi:hypothetical protein
MIKNFLCLVTIVLAVSISAFAQGTVDKNGVYHPSEEELAANKRLAELLRHPTFITLRLTSVGRDVPREGPSDTPSPYNVGDWIHFQLSITNSFPDTLFLSNLLSPYYEYRPELSQDGEILPYSKRAQASVDRADQEPHGGSTSSGTLVPGRENPWAFVLMEDWYEPLAVGHYQLTVRKRFVGDGEWVESNPAVFDVRPRRAAAPIPNGVKLRLVPENAQPSSDGQPYRFGSEVDLRVDAVNDSDQPLRVSVIDSYYGNRPQLFKDGKLVPYLEETAKLIESKDATPRLVDIVSDFFIDPKSYHPLGLGLKYWYGPLSPGLYRLINRRRLEIDGPWTADSAELLFEVVPQPPMK